MTDQSRQTITDKLAALSPSGLHWDCERHAAYLIVYGIAGLKGQADGDIIRRYLSEIDPDWFDTSDWNAMVEWENTRYLLDVYDLKGPDAALLHRLGQNTTL